MNMKEKCTHTHLTRRGESNALEEWRNSSLVKKIPKLTGEEFTNEDWLHCLYRRRFKTRFEICKDEDGKNKRYSCDPKTFIGDNYSIETELHYVSLQGEWHTHRRGYHTKKRWHTKEVTHCLLWGPSTRSILCCKSWIGNRRKRTQRRKSANFLRKQKYRRSRSNYRCQEAEEGELSNLLKIWTKCRVLNSLVRDENSDILRNPCETKIKFANVRLRPNSVRESQLVERGITRTSSAY